MKRKRNLETELVSITSEEVSAEPNAERERERGKRRVCVWYPMSENENGERVVFMVTTQYTLHSLFFVLTVFT